MVGMGHIPLSVAPAGLDEFRMIAIGQPPIGVSADLPGRAKVDEAVATETSESAQVIESVEFFGAVKLGSPGVERYGRDVEEEDVQFVAGNESVCPLDQEIDAPVLLKRPVFEVVWMLEATQSIGHVGPVEDFDTRDGHRILDSH